MAQGSTRGIPVDIDATLALNSDLVVPSQKAIKTYVDNGLSGKQAILGYTPVNKAGDSMLGDLILYSDPTVALQAATKKYVDENVTAGIQLHDPVRAETTANLNATYVNGGTTPTVTTITGNNTLTATAHGLVVNDIIVFNTTSNGLTAGTPYFVNTVPSVDTFTLSLSFSGIQITTLTNGTGLTLTSRANSGVGATLTNAGAQAALVIDGVTMAVNDRVLVRLQTNGAQNGVYVVTSIGSGSTNWVLTRSADANKYGPKDTTKLGQGDYFYTSEGVINIGDSHILNTAGTIVFGTTSLSFPQFSGSITYTGGTNINITGQVISLTGQVAVANGGTGASTLTGVLIGNGTSAVTAITGTASQLLRRNAGDTAYEFFTPSYITLTSLSATSPLNYNNTTGAFTITQASGSQNGFLSSTDWTTFNNKQNAITLTTTGSSGSSTLVGSTLNIPTYTISGLGGVPTTRQLTINGTAYDLSLDRTWSVGTVTSVAALTIGTTGTDITSTVATGTTTPVITLNIPSASATSRGVLTSNDYNTFSLKQSQITLTTTGSSGASTFIASTLNIPNYTLSGLGGVPTSRTLTINSVSYDLSADRSWTIGPTIYSRGLQKFTATAGQTTFTITNGYTVGLVDVYRNGVKLDNATEFTATNTTTVVLTDPAALNDVIEVYKYGSEYIPNNALRQVNTFTATAGQTTFSVTYSVGLIDVFYNGARLAPAEYTATNGTSVVFANACIVGDIVEIIAYSYLVNGYSGISGSGTSNYIPKFTSATSIGNSLIYDTGSNIGINTIDPQTILNGFSSSARGVAISNTYPFIAFNDTDGGNFYVGTQGNIGYIWNAGTDSLILATNNAARLTISSTGAATFSSSVTAGNLGFIATNAYGFVSYSAATATGANISFGSSVYNTFDGIYQSSGSTRDFGIWLNGGTINDPKFVIKNGGNVGIGTTSPSYLLSFGGDAATTVGMNQSTLGTAPSFTFRGADSTTGTNNEGGAVYISSGLGTGNGTTSNIIFSTGAPGASGTTRQSLAERMRITSGGQVGIKTTPSSGWGSAMSVLQVGTGGVMSNWTGANANMNIGVNYYDNGAGSQLRLYAAGVSTIGFNENVITFNRAASSTAGSTITFSESMRITSGGRVGINQTSPGVALSVAGQSENWQLALTSVTATAGAVIGSPSADVLAFGNWAGTERMRINSNGNVSIGNTSSTYRLDVSLDSGSNGQIIRLNRSAGAYGWGIGIDSSSVFGIYDNGGTQRLTLNTGGQLEIYNNIRLNGSSTILRLDNSGGTPQGWWVGQDVAGTNDGIFYIFNQTSGTQAINISKTNVIRFNQYGAGTLTTNSTGVISASDGRFKNKTKEISNALDKVLQLKPTYYKWKEDCEFYTEFEELGFIAQEVGSVIPEASPEQEQEGKYKNYSDRAIIAMLTKAIQELKQELDTLKNK